MKLEIQNMTCGGCARSVTATIKELDPAAQVNIDIDSKIVDVETKLNIDQVTQALTEDGFPPVVKN
ncbi:heavy-metal-associated domain-containing protein [Acinetobacter sp.]|uniref:heavy-metal-associated domain-containing protein n=1 Tax=Acinetobacter sp. TaxID=472 RepID=UPI0031CFD94E